MLFKDIVGRELVKQKLIDLVVQNRLSHALLFLGKEGSGALPLAIAFANFVSVYTTKKEPSLFGDDINNISTLPTTSAEADAFMQSQEGFIKNTELIHPDIHYTYPVITDKPGKVPISTDFILKWRTFIKEQPYSNIYDWLQFIGAENKQGNITSAECTEIIHKISLKSFESDYKILVLWMPEYLGKEGNKLLKLIEEPPANTLFILVAENEDQILSTILSRTQLIKVPLAEDEEIIQYLRTTVDIVQAMQITSSSEGNIREALILMNHSEINWIELVKDCFNAVFKTGPIGMVKWVNACSELGREKQKLFLKYFLQTIEHCIKANILGINSLILPETEIAFLEKLINKVPVDLLEEIANQVNSNIYHIERNANAKLLFHSLIIRIYHIIANKSVILVN